MADTEKIVHINLTSSSELTKSLIEQLGKAFVELEACEVAYSSDVKLHDVEEHFHHMEAMMNKKLEELEAKEKIFAERESHNRMLISQREAAVITEEQDLLDKVQELKDAAVATIAEARGSHKPESLEPASTGDTKENQAFLKVLRRNSQGNGDATLQNNYNARELEALRAVIDCVKEYKLEADYPLGPLQKRVAQLDKSTKGDRKRTGETGKQQEQKRPRSNGEFLGPRARGPSGGRQGPRTFTKMVASAGIRGTFPSAVSSAYNYSLSPYVAQASDQRSYYHAQDDRASGPCAATVPSYAPYMQGTRRPYM